MTLDIDLFSGSSGPSTSSAAAAAFYGAGSSWQGTSRRLIKTTNVRALSCKTSCIHPQLRDLLVCPVRAGEVIGHSYHTVSRYSFGKRGISGARGRRDSVCSLSFIPNVLVSGCGLLACGGHTAELALRSTDGLSSWCVQTHVGKSINNSVHISPSPFHPLSTPRIHVSNNDCCVYWYQVHFPKRWGTLEIQDEWQEGSLPGGSGSDPATSATGGPELEYIDKARFDTPINHTSVSPDGRSMVAVGDTNQVFVFDINAHGQHTLIDTVEASDDASFSTSWSRTGEAFAVASQDGCVTIFDRRHLRALKQFRTYQRNSSSGAARVVKYSKGPHELLAFSEQKNYIHVVDARTYEYSERIHLPSVAVEDNQRLEWGGSVQSALRDLIRRHPRHSEAITASLARRGINPWDTYASESVSAHPVLDWRDCPIQTSDEDHTEYAMSAAAAAAATTNYQTLDRSSDDRRAYAQNDHPYSALPTSSWAATSTSSLPSAPPGLDSSSTSYPQTPRHPQQSQLQQERQTVAEILGDRNNESSVSSGSTGLSGAPSSSAITGLEWDPTGTYLYASMERIILEWQVDSASRRCHPHATIL